jgi:hypothetical protein
MANFDLGRTATHEVGHWMGLIHIWGDDNGACWGSDQVADTPNQGNFSSNVPTFPTVDNCTTSNPGIMFMNYMDYTDDIGMNMFTNGQKERMRANFNPGGFRENSDYAFGMSVSGPSIVCTSESFTLDNPPQGSSVSWQATPSNFFTTSSGNGTTANLQLQSSSVSGSATLTFNIQAGCSVLPVSINFYAGKVAVPDIGINPFEPQQPLGPGYPYVCPNTTYSAFLWPEGFSYEISVTNGSYSQPVPEMPHFYWIHMGNYTPSNYVDASIQARVDNGCGWSDYKYVDLYGGSCGSGGGCELCLFSIFPNPSNDEVFLELDEEVWETSTKNGLSNDYQLSLKDEKGTTWIELKSIERKTKLDIRNIPEGTYYLFVNYNQTSSNRRILIKR